MATSAGAQGVTSIGGAYSQAQALNAQGDYQRRVGEMNSSLARIKADDAMSRGYDAAKRNDLSTRRLIGTQRAGYASQGIDVNTGSAAEVQSDTATLGALDSLTIKNNAWKEAWGYKVEGDNASFAGKFAGMADDNAANNTLLTGGMRAASYGLQSAYYAKTK